MKNKIVRSALLSFALISFTIQQSNATMTDTNYVSVSQQLLYAIRTGDRSDTFIKLLEDADEKALQKELQTDALKKAFWLNIYNAFVQKLLSENPGKYKNRNAFFSDKQIVIAHHKLSFDNIEHGILRRSKIKWSLGYLNKPFAGNFEKTFRVDILDKRIHFALNCGAKSCPPIAYYDPAKIDMQLRLAMINYLRNETEYNTASNIIYLPKIMDWFGVISAGKKML
ncbi:MAG: DUF547 domain-containing protein [Chitinophagaceae bacterium]|nr:DUF547 domain-containing protein [Chitinophagaceae bacterium]